MNRTEFVHKQLKDDSISTLVLTAYNWAHRAVHGTHTAVLPFYTALQTGEIPVSEERLNELLTSLRSANFVLYVFAGFLDRYFQQNRQHEITEVSKRIAPES